MKAVRIHLHTRFGTALAAQLSREGHDIYVVEKKSRVIQRETDHLDAIVATGPLGEWWEQCAFWEDLVKYIESMARTGADARLAPICDRIAAEASELAASQPADQQPGRSARLRRWRSKTRTSSPCRGRRSAGCSGATRCRCAS